MDPDPFEALGLERRFDLDPLQVRAAWRERAAALHPDRLSGADEAEAARRAALLNAAQRTLEDPERRADALLVLLGGPAREAEKSLPPEFLLEVMEVREALEEAIAAGDEQAVRGHEDWASRRRDEIIADVGSAFAALTAPPDSGALRDIRVQLNAWRYIERMLEQIEIPGAGAP